MTLIQSKTSPARHTSQRSIARFVFRKSKIVNNREMHRLLMPKLEWCDELSPFAPDAEFRLNELAGIEDASRIKRALEDHGALRDSVPRARDSTTAS